MSVMSFDPSDFQDMATLQAFRQRQLTNQAIERQNELIAQESERQQEYSRAKQSLFNYKIQSQNLRDLVQSFHANPKMNYRTIKAAVADFRNSRLAPDLFDELEYKQLSADLRSSFEQALEWAEKSTSPEIKHEIEREEAERQMALRMAKDADRKKKDKENIAHGIIVLYIITAVAVALYIGIVWRPF